MRWIPWGKESSVEARWALAYATVDVSETTIRQAATRVKGAKLFGCTSFQGVFTPKGFSRGLHLLVGDEADGISMESTLVKTTAGRARSDAKSAATQLLAKLGEAPKALLLHATPGFEERIVEGLDDATGGVIPVYGGSAADDDLSGKWRVFSGMQSEKEGFVVAAIGSSHSVFGSFVAGYLPSNERGTVTAAHGRVVHSIDDQPAARIYNQWTNGRIAAHLQGGVILGDTSLAPLGRLIDKIGGTPRYLLSHPHEVLPDGSLSFFTDMSVGDSVVLMLGSEDSLLERTRQAAQRALGGSKAPLTGGVLVYCGGCVGAIGNDAAQRVASMFGEQLGNAPFIGAATFGEQGCFPARRGADAFNRHGNLMCDAVLFSE